MRIVNPSGVKFTNKYLNWFRCLGLEDHGFGGAANGGKKAASNAKRYPLCENRRIPFTRNPPVSCLLGRCPNPRRTQNLCSGTMDSSSRIAYPSPHRKRQGSVTSSLVLSPQSHGFAGYPVHRLRDFSNRLWAGSSALLRLFFPSFIRFLLFLVQLQNTVDIGLGRQ